MGEEESKKYLFEKMPVKKALFSMAVPTIISQLINLVYNMVDTIFIGQTGDAYKTAAVTLAFSIFMLTIAFSNLFGIGGGSLIARLTGAGKEKQARSVCAFSFYGSIAVALLYSLLIGVFQTPILRFLGASDNTIGFAKQYLLLVVIIGNVPVILSGTAAHLLRNTGYSRQASIGLSAGGILNVILDPLFMFVILPDGMEVFGAALATLLSNVAACIYLIFKMHSISKHSPVSMNPADLFRISQENIKVLFDVGIPSALLNGLFDVANIVLNALMASHGDLELAAIGIVMKAERLPNAVNIGICQGMLPIVAYNFASGNHPRMDQVIKTARKYGLGISFASLVLFEACSPLLCSLFMNTGAGTDRAAAVQTIAFAAIFLRIRCLASPLQFLNYSTSFGMQAVGYGRGTLMHAVFRELVFYIPFMFVLNGLFGTYGLSCAIIFGEGAGAMFAIVLFDRWKKKNLMLA